MSNKPIHTEEQDCECNDGTAVFKHPDKEHQKEYRCIDGCEYCERTCNLCQGKGKTTKLIFKAEDCSNCNNTQESWNVCIDGPCHRCRDKSIFPKCKDCNGKGELKPPLRFGDFPARGCPTCKGTGLILPKKDEVRCANCGHLTSKIIEDGTGQYFHYSKNPENWWTSCFECDCKEAKPFHLTKDAKVKSVEELGIIKQNDYGLIKINPRSSTMKVQFKHNLKESDKIVICEGYYE